MSETPDPKKTYIPTAPAVPDTFPSSASAPARPLQLSGGAQVTLVFGLVASLIVNVAQSLGFVLSLEAVAAAVAAGWTFAMTLLLVYRGSSRVPPGGPGAGNPPASGGQ
ncbi:hypothetical protein DB346_08560 [Verrucomicrobia bacterium LW23]|nr:hypothetical protein DB346_08560 [Verrucomicrobia bacterium LW23]